MKSNAWSELIELMKIGYVDFDEGLSDLEISLVESKYGFLFPPDLRDFFQTALPKGDKFYKWRSEDDEQIRSMMQWPLHGILFDVEHNAFWPPEWGVKPPLPDDAKVIATKFIRQAPVLIPIYAHRFIPESPNRAGNPVFSVYQTDIIHYGFDLDDYFRNEFNLPGRKEWPSEIRTIEFWDVEHFDELRDQ